MLTMYVSFMFIVFFTIILIHQQVYALKQYTNEEYNIKFQYPEEWMQLSYIPSKEFEIEYDKIYLPELWMDVKNNAYENMQIILYTDEPNSKEFVKIIKKEVLYDPRTDFHIQDITYMTQTGLQSAMIYINYQDPLTGLSFNRDYILFANDGIGYAIKYVSEPHNTDKYLDNVLNITNQIINNISR